MTKIFNIQIDEYESSWTLRLRVKSPCSLRVHSLTVTSSQTKLTYLLQYMTNSYTQFSIYELKITHFRLQYMQNSCTKFSTSLQLHAIFCKICQYGKQLYTILYKLKITHLSSTVYMPNSCTQFSTTLWLHVYSFVYNVWPIVKYTNSL